MSNKKITDLTELTTPTTDDVFPVVDIATNTTQKVQLGNLPTTPAVTSALASKQATLISGTNIKTVNGTSVLGSGDINIPLTPPSGVSGAIQFSTGSAFASDATNLFWDDTNNRLGIGLNTPVAGPFQVKTTQSNANGSIIFTNNTTATILAATDTGSALTQLQFRASSYNFTDTAGMRIASTGYATTPTAMLQVVGSGTTSGTTSLLVQNSGGSNAFAITDDRVLNFYNQLQGPLLRASSNLACSSFQTQNYAGLWMVVDDTTNFGNVNFGTTTAVASARVQIDSTTKGFLPPRMTTTQKNAISSPAAGLQVYDTTLNQMSYYNGSSWVNI